MSRKNPGVKATKNAELISPCVLPYEIGNALYAMNKQKKLSKDTICRCFELYKQIPVRLIDADMANALSIAISYNIYAYDAYYLELAKRLKLSILSLDRKLIEVAHQMNLKSVEVK